MKTLNAALEKVQESLNKNGDSKFNRFRLYTIHKGEKERTVGMGYLREGSDIYTLRLWTWLNEKFFLVRSTKDQGKYLLMTRELNKGSNSKNKYHWNIIGSAVMAQREGALELSFDLLEKKIYLNLIPEFSSNPYGQEIPKEALDMAA